MQNDVMISMSRADYWYYPQAVEARDAAAELVWYCTHISIMDVNASICVVS